MGVEASAAVTSVAETAAGQARQQVTQGAIEPNLSMRIAVHGSAASNRRARAREICPMQGRVPISPTYAGPVSITRKQRKQSRRLPS